MSIVLLPESSEARQAITELFDNKSPVLLEIRFSRMGTSPDWYLVDEEEQLQQILEKLGAGVEVYLTSVWDLKSSSAMLCLKLPES